MTAKTKIKILNSFPNPMTNRMLKVGDEITVPVSQFWLKRLAEKDCEKITTRKKAKAKSVKSEEKADVKNKLKGSK